MPLTETDLRALLSERSAEVPLVVDRLDRVRGRLTHRRRRRQLAGAVASFVVLLAVAAVVATPHWLNQPTTPSISAPTDPPEYYMGGKLIANATLRSAGQSSTSLTFTPTNWDLRVYVKCTGPEAVLGNVWVNAIVNGHLAPTGNCSGSGSWSIDSSGSQTQWSSWGVELGKPSTLAVSPASFPVNGASPSPLPQWPTGLLIEVGVYQRVPLDQYVFPSRPAKLHSLDLGLPSYEDLMLDSRKAGANGHWTIPVTLSQFADVTAYIVAPGAVAFSVAGKQVGACNWWDYTSYDCSVSLNPASLEAAGVSAHDGDTVEVTVTASRFSDPAWKVTRREHGPDQTAQP